MGATGIQWGAYNGKLHLGIEYRWDDIGIYSDTSHVYADVYYAANAWGYNSAETITYSGSAGGSVNYTLYSATGSSDTQFIATVDFGVQSTSYSGGPSWSLGVSTTPAYDGSAPSVTVGFTLPARPPTVPNPPPTGVDSITSSSARIVVGAAYDNGSGVDWYGAWVMTNNAWPDSGGNVVASAAGGTFTATGLAPGTQYFYTARAHNAVGYSGYTDMKVFTTAAAPPSAPGVTIDQITSSSLRVTVATPAANGAAIDSYQFQVATDSGFANVVSWPAVQQGTVSGLARVTVYYIRGSAHNSAGWSSWGPTSSVQTLATVPDQTATPSVSAILTDSASVAWSAPRRSAGNSSC